MSKATPEMEQYFKKINDEVLDVYDVVKKAKSKGFDPDDEITVPLAKNMAERVTGLISTVAPEILGTGIVKRIGELEEEYGSQDWRVALKIAEEVAKENFCKFEDKKKAIEIGIRIGFAYVTVGVVASPLEGFVELRFNKRKDNGEEYFCPMYSGPIRSAGGTGASVSALIIDYVRKKMGYAQYDATEEEIKRAYTELCDYHERVTNLQYFPSEEEVEFLMKHIPIQINGDASEKYEVSNHKDLSRIETNRIRNGFCLMIAECLSLKAPKIWKQLAKWGDDFDMDQWMFMKDFVALQKEVKARGGGSEKKDAAIEEVKIKPDFIFLKDVVAGRPVLTYPLRNGGFRLRYGRGRTTGLSSDALHPATMVVLDDFMAIGTQMKTERPGKSTVFSSCDSLDGPIVKLKDGSVKRLDTFEEAKKINKDVIEIIYLGDILVNYGDILNRAHKLIPVGFVEEWWVLFIKGFMDEKKMDAEKLSELVGVNMGPILNYPIKTKVTLDEALMISKKLNVPLHPRWIYYWNSLKKEEFLKLYNALKNAVVKGGKIILPEVEGDVKRSLELIGAEHKVVSNEFAVIEKEDSGALMENLGYFKKEPKGGSPLEMVNSVSTIVVKDKLGQFVGGRMGRPEKAKMRKLNGSPHTLFPIGEEGGRLRCFQSALEKGKVYSDFPNMKCEKCNKHTIYKVCEECGSRTKRMYYCRKCRADVDTEECDVLDANGKHGPCMVYKRMQIDINHYFDNALSLLGTRNYPDLIKGIRGTSNQEHIPEHPLKGILRAKHGIYVNKDGTTRYDMIEMCITHFKPMEVGVSVEKLRSLGYTKDCYGEELKYENQILELKPQDIILPACEESPDEGSDKVLLNVTKFIDDLLVHLYGLEPYYNAEKTEDLVGQLCVAMSPHTSAGIVCRIAGFSKTQGFLAHPYLHSIMRRDCDGDEAATMLLFDHLLNFSRKYLPNSRGATQDAPLVLTSRLIPAEVDDMVFDMDTVWEYPMELYEAAENWKYPWNIKIEMINDRLNKEEQYEGMGFTHDTEDINAGVRCSSYKTIPSMQEKVLAQMKVAEKIRAVDEDDVARLIIERHFLRDIKGNLRKFSMQSFRCVNCNEIYRRPPLVGKCTRCGGKIIFTIAEGSVKKYLEPAIDLAKKYNLPPFLQQTLDILKTRIDSVFGIDPERQEGLNKWFG